MTRQTVRHELYKCETKLFEIVNDLDDAVRKSDECLVEQNQSRLVHIAGRVTRLHHFAPDNKAINELLKNPNGLANNAEEARNSFGEGGEAASPLPPLELRDNAVVDHPTKQGAIPKSSSFSEIPVPAADDSIHPLALEAPPKVSSPQLNPLATEFPTRPNPSLTDIFSEASETRNVNLASSVQRLLSDPAILRSITTTQKDQLPYVEQPHQQAQLQLPQQQYQQLPHQYQQKPQQYQQKPQQYQQKPQQYQHQQQQLYYPQLQQQQESQYQSRQPPQSYQQSNQQAATVSGNRNLTRTPPREFVGGHRIHQWALRFDGKTIDIDPADFLYQVERKAILNGVSLDSLTIGLGDLLIGLTGQWLWTYTRKFSDATWPETKAAFLHRYAPHQETDFDIRSKIERRRQLPGENFYRYCQDIESLAKRLSHRMTEHELVGIIRRNMSLILRKEMWVRQFSKVNDLLIACTRYEKLCNEVEYFPDVPLIIRQQ